MCIEILTRIGSRTFMSTRNGHVTQMDETFLMIAVLTALFGGIIFLVNVCILFVIVKMISSQQTYNDKFGFLIHIFFVSIIDTCCGVALFLIGLINVEGQISARVCAFIMFASFTFQLVSQGNIACVCFQRFIITKHVQNVEIKWKSSYTKTLFVVNSLIGIISLVTLQTQSTYEDIPYSYGPCKGSSVMGSMVGTLAATILLIGLIFTVVGDVFCALTFYRLRRQVKMSVESDTTNVGTMTDNQPNTSISTSIRIRKQKALRTLLLIVASFNLSLLTYIIGNIHLMLQTSIGSVEIQRFVFLTMFINSFVNPIIIAVRIKYVSIHITTLLSKGITYMCRFFGRPNR